MNEKVDKLNQFKRDLEALRFGINVDIKIDQSNSEHKKIKEIKDKEDENSKITKNINNHHL